MMVRQAVVLVGGKGTRLGSIAAQTPKPMLEVRPGLRFLDVVLFELARHGFTDIILSAGHLGAAVEATYAQSRILESTVRILREPEPQGTGGALRFAAEHLAPWFLMMNGDSLFQINLRDFTRISAMGTDDFAARIALREVSDPSRYGTVTVSGEQVVGFEEKRQDRTGAALINGGIYLIRRDTLDLIKGVSSIERDVFPQLADTGKLRGRRFDGYFLDIGLPDAYQQAQQEIPDQYTRPCAFLDRDGVLNRDLGYTHKLEDLSWMPGAIEGVKLLNDSGYLVVVVTNQAGIAKGHYEEAAMHRFHETMTRELADHGAHIDAFYHCPFHDEASIEAYRFSNHPDRKPNPGMIVRAFRDLPVRREGSFLIGDRQTDMDAAKKAGLPHAMYAGDNLATLIDEMLHKARMASAD